MTNKNPSFEQILKSIDKKMLEMPQSEDTVADTEGYPLADAGDAGILMHRDAHFGGKFAFMREYYQTGGKGVNPEFEMARIEYLDSVEQASGENLAATLLSGSEAERVARARETYRQLRDVYELSQGKRTPAQLIADLILSEDEEAEAEVNAIVAEGPTMVDSLLHLISAQDFYDPLFPGYGQAPLAAARALGKLGDKRAVIKLFEMLGGDDFFADEIACKALVEIGEPAKKFLLNVVHSRPLNSDNERAALALVSFHNDPEVARACLVQLRDSNVLKHESLATYLVLACSGLREQVEQEEYRQLSQRGDIPRSLKLDMESVMKEW